MPLMDVEYLYDWILNGVQPRYAEIYDRNIYFMTNLKTKKQKKKQRLCYITKKLKSITVPPWINKVVELAEHCGLLALQLLVLLESQVRVTLISYCFLSVKLNVFCLLFFFFHARHVFFFSSARYGERTLLFTTCYSCKHYTN